MPYSRRNFLTKTALAMTTVSGGSILTAAQRNEIHIVKKGDTLSHIAIRYGVSVHSLKLANGLSGDLIRIGQKLYIPASNKQSDDLLINVREQNKRIAVRRKNWNTVVVHHSAIKYGNATIYDRSHRQRGMRNGLAYHFVIGNGIDSGDGEIEIGPRWRNQLHGGHVRNHKVNLTAIGICLVGNFETHHPSKKQLEAFMQLMDWLRTDVLQKKVRFAGHKDIERNLCPGKNFPLAEMHARYD